MRRAILKALCAFPLLVCGGEPAADIAFQNTPRLLHVQMKLRVLQRMHQQGFFVPKTWVQIYLDEQQELTRELDEKMKLDVQALDDWVVATEKVRKAETDTLEKLTVDTIKKGLKLAAAGASDPKAKDKGIWTVLREYESRMLNWDAAQKNKAIDMVTETEVFLKRLFDERVAAGGELNDLEKQWRSSVSRLYRGAVSDKADLVEGLRKIDRERIHAAACLTALRHVNNGLYYLDKATDPRSGVRQVIELAKDKAVAYLQENFKVNDAVKRLGLEDSNAGDYLKQRFEMNDAAQKANFKWSVDQIYKMLDNGLTVYNTFSDYDRDPLLNQNPVALATCKRFAVLTSMYTVISSTTKDLAVMAPLKPLFEIFDFYAKAAGLVAEFARLMQGFVNKVDQDVVDIRAINNFNVIPSTQEFLHRTSLLQHFGLKIALRDKIYYLVVPKTVAQSEYVELTQEQYDRLAQALADERLVFGVKAASAGYFSALPESIFDFYDSRFIITEEQERFRDDVVDQATKNFLKTLKAEGKKTVFTDQELIALAKGEPVDHASRISGKIQKWTAADFRDACESMMDELAEEQAIRSAVPKCNLEIRKEWRTYKSLVGQSKVALTPDQMYKLFSYYHEDASKAQHVQDFLKKTTTNRMLNRLGAARVGIPLITTDPPVETIESGAKVNLVAYLVVSDLADNREVEATVKWVLPSGPVISRRAKLHNGQVILQQQIVAPSPIPGKDFAIKLNVKVPLEDGEIAADGSAVIPVGFDPASAPPAILLPQPRPAASGAQPPPATSGSLPAPIGGANNTFGAFNIASGAEFLAGLLPPTGVHRAVHNEFEGGSAFEKEVSGGLTLKCTGKFVSTLVEVTSEAFGQLDPRSNEAELRVTVYGAVSPGGPFEQLSSIPLSGDMPVQPEAHFGRIAKDKYLFLVDPDQFPENFEHKLAYFRATQTSLLNGLPSGKEIRSKTWSSPGKAVINSLSIGDDNKLTMSGSSERLAVHLSAADQAFDAWGAHFSATVGSITFHGYSPSRIPGQDKPLSKCNAPATVHVPFGKSVTFKASGYGLSATRTVTIVPDEAFENQRKQQLEFHTKDAEAARKMINGQIDGVRNEIASWQQRMAKERDPIQIAWCQLDIAKCQSRLRILSDVDLASVDSREQLTKAGIERNAPAAMAAYQQLMALTKRRYELNLAGLDAEISGLQRVPAKPMLESAKAARPGIQENYEQNAAGEWSMLRGYAFSAGDAATYKACCLNWGKLYKGNDRDSVAATMVLNMADDWVALTGQREQAARLLLLGWAAYNAQNNISAQDAQARLKSLPEWWPPNVTPQYPGVTNADGYLAAIQGCTPSAAPFESGGTVVAAVDEPDEDPRKTPAGNSARPSATPAAPIAKLPPMAQEGGKQPGVAERTPPPANPQTPKKKNVKPPKSDFGPSPVARPQLKAKLAEYDQILARNSHDRAARLDRAAARVWSNDLKGALQDYRQLLKDDESDVQASRNAALLELLVGDPIAARTQAEELLKLFPDTPSVLTLCGQASLWTGQNDQAKHLFERAREVDPAFPDTLHEQARKLIDGAPAAAFMQFTAVLWMKPEAKDALFGAGQAASRGGMKHQAIQAFEQYLKADPNGEFAQTARSELERLKK